VYYDTLGGFMNSGVVFILLFAGSFISFIYNLEKVSGLAFWQKDNDHIWTKIKISAGIFMFSPLVFLFDI
jgi:hypothetical protein